MRKIVLGLGFFVALTSSLMAADLPLEQINCRQALPSNGGPGWKTPAR